MGRKVPPGSFIAMDDFPGPRAMATHLTALMDNETAYMAHFEWRRPELLKEQAAAGEGRSPHRGFGRINNQVTKYKEYIPRSRYIWQINIYLVNGKLINPKNEIYNFCKLI
jgi:hypothetical protein